MDNKQAIKNIKDLKKWKYLGDRKYMVALDKAIKSLEKVEELERWNKVLQDRIDFFEKKQGCEYCASEPLGDYCNLEYYNNYLLEAWNKVIKELDEQYDDVYDFYYQQGIEFALELIKKYKKEIEE